MEFNSSRPGNWFLFGDLLCISMDESFQKPVWAVVEKHIDQQRFVIVTKCSLPLLIEISVFFKSFIQPYFFSGGGGGGEQGVHTFEK